MDRPDVDVCRAVAAAIFGDADKVKYLPLSSQQRFTALQSGEVDMLAGNATWTLTRDTALGLDFTGVSYYDGQSFLVTKKLGVKSAKELNGATICVAPGTTTELNLADYFRANKMTFKPVVIEKVEEIRAAFFSGRCDVYTNDSSSLYATRAANVPPPAPPTTSSSCPRSSPRSRWARWCAMATTSSPTSCAGRSTPCSRPRNTASRPRRRRDAEERQSVDQAHPRRHPGHGQGAGGRRAWVSPSSSRSGTTAKASSATSAGLPLKIERGLNRLWTQGGLQYAPPIR